MPALTDQLTEQLQAAQNAELDLRRENQQLREQLAHAAGFLEGLAGLLESPYNGPHFQAIRAGDCRALAEHLRKAAGMTDCDTP